LEGKDDCENGVVGDVRVGFGFADPFAFGNDSPKEAEAAAPAELAGEGGLCMAEIAM